MKNEDKNQKNIGAMFDRIAPTYDRLNRILSLSIDKRWRKKAVGGMDIAENDLVLDLASGTGDMSFLALKMRPGCRVIGLDLSRNMLRLAHAKNLKKNFNGNCGFVSGDAFRLPFRDDTFDKAMVAFGIRNMPDIPSALTEIRRVLKEGGTLTILEFSPPEKFLAKALYSVYFRFWLPLVGRFVSGDDKAYRYLPESINTFLSVEEMDRTITDAGFEIWRSVGLFPGISHLHMVARSEA